MAPYLSVPCILVSLRYSYVDCELLGSMERERDESCPCTHIQIWTKQVLIKGRVTSEHLSREMDIPCSLWPTLHIRTKIIRGIFTEMLHLIARYMIRILSSTLNNSHFVILNLHWLVPKSFRHRKDVQHI